MSTLTKQTTRTKTYPTKSDGTGICESLTSTSSVSYTHLDVYKRQPLGYAGNPAGHRAVAKHVAEMLDMQVENIVSQMRL